MSKERVPFSAREILQQVELIRIRKLAEVEMVWWESELKPKLVEVPIEGDAYRLIGKLRHDVEPRKLSELAIMYLEMITKEWKDRINKLELKECKLSVTSLYRDGDLQRKLIFEGANAAINSSHGLGMAFDFDPNGYYLGEERKPVNRFDVNFNPKYTQLLYNLLVEERDAGRCNFIREYGYEGNGLEIKTYPSCFHVCVSPNLEI